MPTTWNSGDMTANIVLSGGNLTATLNNFGVIGVRSLASTATGKSYWEYTLGSGSVFTFWCGLCNASVALGTAWPGNSAWAGMAVVDSGGTIYYNNLTGANIGGPNSNNTICWAVDFDAQRFWARLNAGGNWNGSGTANPATGVGGLSLTGIAGSGTAGYAEVGGRNSGGTVITGNFGASGFVGAVPSGFTAGFPPAAGGGAASQARAMVLA